MIRGIDIENFRCFHKTHIEGFSQINLIGGQNNAGKTAILEAILLANNPGSESILFLQQKLRGEYGDPQIPERTWNSLFFAYNKQKEIKITAIHNSITFGSKLECRDIVSTPKVTPTLTLEGNIQDIIKIEDNSYMTDILESSLIVYQFTGNTIDSTMQIDAIKGHERLGGKGNILPALFPTHFVPAGFKQLAERLAENFERLLYQGRDKVVLEALQLIDKTIEKIDIIGKKLHLKRQAEVPMPIGMFGDALNKLVDIVIRMADNPNCILLIDEIENGIHYTHQYDLWKRIFVLAKEFNVQIFAVSHSLEMIKAFNSASIDEDFGDKVAYFEMFRSQRSNEIVANFLSQDTLSYAIANNQSFRGE